MKTLILAAALFQPAAAPTVPQMYSFADVYRLTVSGAAMADFPSAAGVQRVAVTPQPQPEAAAFSVRAVPVPERSLLIFSGLAAAFWVARRRLGYSF
jgi:zona occludens toxin (predicted ATPase)